MVWSLYSAFLLNSALRLNNWSGTIVPLTPAVCLLEDRPHGALVTASSLYCSILFFFYSFLAYKKGQRNKTEPKQRTANLTIQMTAQTNMTDLNMK